VIRYLKGTLNFGFYYNGYHDFRLIGYTDFDWDRSVSDRNITSGCCFSLGSSMTLWQSRKQSNISLITTELFENTGIPIEDEHLQ
jgi:hypothetical protein